MTGAALDIDGNGIVTGHRGSVLVGSAVDEPWETPEFARGNRDRVSGVTMSGNGDTLMVVLGWPTTIFLTTRDQEEWLSKRDLAEALLEDNDDVALLAFSFDGKKGLLGGRGQPIFDKKGSVFFTTNGGTDWAEPDFVLRDNEILSAAAFSGNGQTISVAGNQGSVFVHHRRWTELEPP